jgi:hypothetical protein
MRYEQLEAWMAVDVVYKTDYTHGGLRTCDL